ATGGARGARPLPRDRPAAAVQLGGGVVSAAVTGALRAGLPVVLPFDTVYGLAAEPHDEVSTRRLYELKGRPPTQPTALVAASVDTLRALLPELDTSGAWHLLPAPLTLLLPT